MRAVALNNATRRLSTGYLFSKIGEFAFEAAFAVAAVKLTDANLLLMGVMYFFRYIPSLVFSPLGGWLADNFPKKNVLLAAELVKGASAISLFLMFDLWEPTVIAVVLASMVMTAGDCLYTPTFRAYFPGIVDEAQLPSLNSGLQAIEDSSSICGPLLFALISIAIGSHATFLFFAVCLVVSMGWMWGLRETSAASRAQPNVMAIFKEALHGMRTMRRSNAPLFAIISCTTVCAMFATSVLRFILPAEILEAFTSEAAVGYIYSLLAAGTVIGSLLYERFNSTTSARSVVRHWCLYGCLLLLSAVALQFNTSVFIAVLFLVGFVGAFVDISIVTNIQLLSKQQDVGKNFSLYYLTAVLGDAVSGLIASLMFLVAGPATFMGMAFLLSVAPLGWNARLGENDEK